MKREPFLRYQKRYPSKRLSLGVSDPSSSAMPVTMNELPGVTSFFSTAEPAKSCLISSNQVLPKPKVRPRDALRRIRASLDKS